MTIATGVVLGLLIITAGSLIAWLLGLYLIGLSGQMVKPKKIKPGKAFAAGLVSASGILMLAAGPLAALWAGIASGLAIIGG